ncbi:succinylglutamate desuccinylase/aspartoacylase family protein [Achromobacter aloeverae]|uniref:Succinylglutamate desuccinylase n=1 Tax=Achromobacter aloeverae TaxID=1750518 RepID=A0A4Q1HCF2_9BURK|nr:succinylglutamate desuccinylase/aspartoacylase family protein [Achromobacter aloeverae]RXN83340.1 succinylglutamate desuccinylase [Achromobacter aloeverae]
MSTQASRITTNIDFDQEGFQTGTLRVPHSVDRSGYGHIPIPIAVQKGGEGPTLLLTGGNHGDEYEGPVALMKLLQRLPSLPVQGRIIVVPGLNFPAYLAGKRTSPIDGANMNRVFPGKRDGTITEMIAHYVDTELFPRADFIFDIHSGGQSFDHLPTLLVYPPEDPARRKQYLAVVEAFASPHAMIMDLLGEDRTYGAAVERQGKFFLCGEFGGFGTCNPKNLPIVEAGLDRLLHALRITSSTYLDLPASATSYMRVNGHQHYVFTSIAGVFESAVSLGDRVKKGDIAARVFNPHAPWSEPLELRFAGEGRVVCLRSFAGVEPGDCIAVLADDTSVR